MTPIYQIHNLVHYYGDKKVLDIPGLKLTPGSIVGLMGPNGSGKSTLLKLLAFAMKPSQGSIHYKGQREKPFSKAVRSRVTLLTQRPYLLKRSVFENLAYGLKIRRNTKNRNRGNMTAQIQGGLERVGLPFDTFARRQWHQLSGGEAQRVAMAARLILEPEVLLLDEPVASVDTASARRIRRAALDARDRFGTTLVIASHDAHWLYDCADSQITLAKGRIQATGEEIRIPWPPAAPTTTARLPRNRLKLFPDTPQEIQLTGTIAAMHRIQQTDKVVVTLDMAAPDAPLVLTLDMETIHQWQLHPGATMKLGLCAKDLKMDPWLRP